MWQELMAAGGWMARRGVLVLANQGVPGNDVERHRGPDSHGVGNAASKVVPAERGAWVDASGEYAVFVSRVWARAYSAIAEGFWEAGVGGGEGGLGEGGGEWAPARHVAASASVVRSKKTIHRIDVSR